jgi:hypothetical protein
MNKIELLTKEPLVFRIVDLEVAVRRNASGSAGHCPLRVGDGLTIMAVWRLDQSQGLGQMDGPVLRRR